MPPTTSTPTATITEVPLAEPPTTAPAVAAAPSITPPSTTTTSPTSEFWYRVRQVTAAELAHSWQEGCPVGPDDLARIDLVHHDFAGEVQEGSIVVARRHAEDVARVFGDIFEAGYPIVSMIPIGELPEDAEDDRDYDNTSGFHCRFVAGTTRWSEHAMGNAIDINTHLNPYHRGNYLWPEGSDRYLDRSLGEPGMIIEGGAVVQAFDAIGWGWGGRWRSSKDYQHFSVSGR